MTCAAPQEQDHNLRTIETRESCVLIYIYSDSVCLNKCCQFTENKNKERVDWTVPERAGSGQILHILNIHCVPSLMGDNVKC